MSENDIEELDSSELGTKIYWDKSYKKEIENYKSYGDFGVVWFDEESQARVQNWMLNSDLISKTDRIVDCGCGNGVFFMQLSKEGFENLTGLDYSQNSVELSQKIAKDQNVNANFKVADLLSENLVNEFGKFKIVHDKGTYDGISLNPDNPKLKRETYINNIYNLLEEDGLFIVTSCNWTNEELIQSFEKKFIMHEIIPTPTFIFGGKIGNIVSSIVFKKQK